MSRVWAAFVFILLSVSALAGLIFVVFLVHVCIEEISPDREMRVVLNVVVDFTILYLLNRSSRRHLTDSAVFYDDETHDDGLLDEESWQDAPR